MKTKKSAVTLVAVSLISWGISQGVFTSEGAVGVVFGLGLVLFYEVLQEEQVKDSYSDLVDEIGEEQFKQIADDLAGEIRRRQ